MFPTLLARTVLCVARRIVDRQLTRNIIYDARRNALKVLQKCAQKTHGAELQSKSQAVMIATADRDELPIRIIQMEAPRQLLGRWFTGVVAVAGPLVLAQETDGALDRITQRREFSFASVFRKTEPFREDFCENRTRPRRWRGGQERECSSSARKLNPEPEQSV